MERQFYREARREGQRYPPLTDSLPKWLQQLRLAWPKPGVPLGCTGVQGAFGPSIWVCCYFPKNMSKKLDPKQVRLELMLIWNVSVAGHGLTLDYTTTLAPIT